MPDSKGSFLLRPMDLLPSRLETPIMKAQRPTTPSRKIAKPQLWDMMAVASDMPELLKTRNGVHLR
ncbi:hypothetical protein D3C72_2463180 [compost metagenome]